MAGYFERRRAVKTGKEWLRHARACRHLREDVAAADQLDRLTAAETVLRQTLSERDVSRIEGACAGVREAAMALAPAKSWHGLRENLEVLVVAVAVAMAFRSYFLQPFKIPTGSMQPTLYGIHYSPQEGPQWFDMSLMRIPKWLLLGQWYTEFKAERAGRLLGPRMEQSGMLVYDIGGIAHALPRDLPLLVKPGDEVVTGQVLARGNRITGDHLFVNRVAWNVRAPQRGEVMVFRTDGIRALQDKKTHYIKRLCGLPEESISIHPPRLIVDGHPADDPGMLAVIQQCSTGYLGYQLGRGMGVEYLGSTSAVVRLESGQYMGFGDNTLNSYDSRYWGPVPASSMVGPAMIVYWPLSRRWGPIK
jgi:signal peptidase I